MCAGVAGERSVLPSTRHSSSIPDLPPPPAVRIAYPCFGNPTKATNGRIMSYPAYGRWRVHNLYVDVWQRSPQSGVLQPYTVMQAYRY